MHRHQASSSVHSAGCDFRLLSSTACIPPPLSWQWEGTIFHELVLAPQPDASSCRTEVNASFSFVNAGTYVICYRLAGDNAFQPIAGLIEVQGILPPSSWGVPYEPVYIGMQAVAVHGVRGFTQTPLYTKVVPDPEMCTNVNSSSGLVVAAEAYTHFRFTAHSTRLGTGEYHADLCSVAQTCLLRHRAYCRDWPEVQWDRTKDQ